MKASLAIRFSSLSLLSLLTVACSLIPTRPSLTLSVSTSPYTGSKISIPYSYASLSVNSGGGSAECVYSLNKWTPADGAFRYLTGQRTTLSTSGSLSFDLTTLLGAQPGNGAEDGIYRLSFEVLSGSYDQQGRPIPVPFLKSSKEFTVHTATGAEVLQVSPAVISAYGGAQTVTVTGVGFSSSSTLQLVNNTGSTLSSSYVSATKMQAVIAPSISSPITSVTIAVTGSTAPSYQLPVLAGVAISSVVPGSGSRSNSQLPVYLSGTSLGQYTSVTLTDAGGTSVPLTNEQVTGSGTSAYLSGYFDLTSLTVGKATLTAKNPDGATSSISFTVTS